MAPRASARASTAPAGRGALWAWTLLVVGVSARPPEAMSRLKCEEAGTVNRGSLGLRPSDVGTCLPDLEPQLPSVSDYRMVIDVADWESSQLVSMVAGILLSEHLGYDVIFNYAPLEHETRRLLAPLPPLRRPARTLEEMPWLWDRTSQERRRVLGENLACVADETRRFTVANMEVWNVPFSPGAEFVGAGLVLGDGIGYHGQSGWFIPASLSDGVGNLWSTYKNLKGQPPQAWQDQGHSAGDFVNCSSDGLQGQTCLPEAGRFTPASCRIWCPKPHAMTIPLWAVMPSYDQGYSEEIIYNNNMDISIHFLGQEEHERKVIELFNGTGGSPGPVLFYSWEPSTLLHRVRALAVSPDIPVSERDKYEVSRLFLPNSACKGPHMDAGPPDSTYRCDLPQQYLAKLVSANMKEEAPFAYDFLSDFQIGQNEIEDMLKRLLLRDFTGASPEQRRQLIFETACSWVHRAARKEKLTNMTQESFYWPKYGRPSFWYSNLYSFGKMLLRNSIFVGIALICVILVERLWVRSSLDSENFLLRIFTSCRRRAHRFDAPDMVRTGSSWHFGQSEEDLTELADTQIDVQFKSENGEAEADAELVAPEILPQVQVCAETLWCKETDQAVTIGVFLSQSCKEQVSIGYQCEDGTGKNGERFEAKKGEFVFEPNERVKSVDIKILDSQDWDAGTFFDFHLLRQRPEHLPLGRSWKTRVQIIDTDAFPKSKHTSDEARRRMSRRAALFEHLYNEYCRLKVNWWLVASARLYIALYETMVLPLVQKFVLDSAVGESRSAVNYDLVLILGAIFLAANLCRRVAEHLIVKYSKGAAVSAELEVMLFNKLWMLSSLTRDTRIQPSRWIAAVMRHAQDVAMDGWVAVAELIQEITCLVLIVFVAFLLISDFFRRPIELFMIGPPCFLLVLFPVAWWLVVEVRKPGQIKKREELDTRITGVYDGFNWLIVQGKDLVRLGRGKSSHFLEERRRNFRKDTLAYAKAYTADSLYQTDSGWVAMWLSTIITLCYFITGSFMLIESKHYGQGTMEMGTFVAMLVNLASFGKALRGVFTILLRIENASYALHKISELLNSPSEEERHLERQKAEIEQFLPGMKSIEMDSIIFQNVTFGYAERSRRLVDNFEAALPLGRVSVLKDTDSSVNSRGGQSTLLRLVAGDLLPTGGQVLVPPHLRVGIVETTPALIGDTLLNNITVLAINDNLHEMAYVSQLNAQAWRLAVQLGMQAFPQLWDAHAIPTTIFIAMTARVMLTDPDVLIVLTSRWQGGPWLAQFMHGLERWHEQGLQAMMGKDDPKDRARKRTLLMTADTLGMEYLKVGDIYEIIHAESESETKSYLTAPIHRGASHQPKLGVNSEPSASHPKTSSPTRPFLQDCQPGWRPEVAGDDPQPPPPSEEPLCMRRPPSEAAFSI